MFKNQLALYILSVQKSQKISKVVHERSPKILDHVRYSIRRRPFEYVLLKSDLLGPFSEPELE